MEKQKEFTVEELYELIKEHKTNLILEKDPTRIKSIEREIKRLESFLPENQSITKKKQVGYFQKIKRNNVENEFIKFLDRTDPVKNFTIYLAAINSQKPTFFISRGYEHDQHDFLIERFYFTYFEDNAEQGVANLIHLGRINTENESTKKPDLEIFRENFITQFREFTTNKLIKKQISINSADFSFISKNEFLKEQVLFFNFKILDTDWKKDTPELLNNFFDLWNFECEKPIFIFLNVVYSKNTGFFNLFKKDSKEEIEKDLQKLIDEKKVFDIGVLKKINRHDIDNFMKLKGITNIDNFIKTGEEITWQEAYERCKTFVENSMNEKNDTNYKKYNPE